MKKLLSVVAAALVALTFVGCVMDEDGINWNTYTKDKQNYIAFYAQIQNNATLKGQWDFPDTAFFAGDDTEGVIKGADNKYTVEYLNTTGDTYRAFKKTALKHAGALIKITFDKATTAGEPSKMGVIFDLKPNATDKNANDFYIVGVGVGDKSYYVSKFTNVTSENLQKYNFGTTAETNPSSEKEIVKFAKNNFTNLPTAAEDGSTSVYVYYKLVKDGSFDWAILANLTDEEIAMFKGNKKFNAVDLSSDELKAKVLQKGNTGAEYEAAPVTKVKATDLL